MTRKAGHAVIIYRVDPRLGYKQSGIFFRKSGTDFDIRAFKEDVVGGATGRPLCAADILSKRKSGRAVLHLFHNPDRFIKTRPAPGILLKR